ncbi:MAG TPA: SDR family NAD(P)-dependent oxidoreductase [Gemmatimonadaceae bacterium]|jgi:short-subunit dehydrogenase|nr:SDR family NAD(P)-dependent oxidoreductase [Gemmatimonadaceae bacterium]
MANKTVVITGGSTGIGEAVAHRLARDGHRLVLAARQRDRLDAVADEASRLGAGGTLVVETDVTRRSDIERLSRAAIDAFGGYDVWINNAGRGITRSVQELTDEDVDAIFAVNVKSVIYGMQVALEHFKQRGHGQIVNVSSFLGRVPLATFRSAYNAAKAAVNALTANLRMELRATHPDIHVTLIMPGTVATWFGRNALGSPADTPMYSGPHVQTVEDVADVFARVIEHPVAEVYTNPASAAMARRYFEDVDAFEKGAENPWRRPPTATT